MLDYEIRACRSCGSHLLIYHQYIGDARCEGCGDWENDNQPTEITMNFETTPAVSAPSISSASMLVELSMSVWTGRKKDKAASADVTSRNMALRGTANVNKKLLGVLSPQVMPFRNKEVALVLASLKATIWFRFQVEFAGGEALIQCQNCLRWVQGATRRRKYCSDSCRQAAHRRSLAAGRN